MNTDKRKALRRFVDAAKELFGEDEVRRALDEPADDRLSDKQNRLITEVPACGQAKTACQRAGVPEGTYRRWRSTNPRFKTAANEALESGRQEQRSNPEPKTQPKGEEASARIPPRRNGWRISPWPSHDDAMPMTAPSIRLWGDAQGEE